MEWSDFEEALQPENWIEEQILHTPTFEALLKADGTLFICGSALFDGFSVNAVQALTRFLSERVTLPPLESLYDDQAYSPKRVDHDR